MIAILKHELTGNVEYVSAVDLSTESIPQRNERMNCRTSALLGLGLSDGAAELRGDVTERGADAGGQSLHAGSRTQSNQGNDQSVFDHILAILQYHQASQSDDELKNPLHKAIHRERQNTPFAQEGSS
jgi:hypothetical protein